GEEEAGEEERPRRLHQRLRTAQTLEGTDQQGPQERRREERGLGEQQTEGELWLQCESHPGRAFLRLEAQGGEVVLEVPDVDRKRGHLREEQAEPRPGGAQPAPVLWREDEEGVQPRLQEPAGVFPIEGEDRKSVV